MHWPNCASNAKENKFAREVAFKPWKRGGGGWEKKHQERFPVVIRLSISNGSIPDILCEIKFAITFECQADSNKSSKQNICLENYSKFNT